MRTLVVTLILAAMLGGHAALAQGGPDARERAAPEQEAPEEVVVRGRRLTDLRFEVEQAQERAYAIFNELNSDDDFDVYCREERRYHSRATQRTCRAQFENRISGAAATEYMRSLSWTCPMEFVGETLLSTAGTQECLFSGYGQSAAHAATAVEGQLPSRREQMNDEIVRLANQDARFAQAIIDWYERNQQYETARERRDED